ncbi:MAG TPA: diguanylate cyclase [Xanthobacteraceae bacterium]|jgi:diguanylate cyclase (GGDEF)-like protein|nr:diguanylate cyclase [Xanthobacteraceae bacterium]
MHLDIPTLFIASICVVALLGLFLFFAWIQERDVRALAWWGGAYMLGGVAVALWVVESSVPRMALNGLPHAVLFIACAMIWNGARLFRGKDVLPVGLLAGAVIWLAACAMPSFVASSLARVTLSSLIVAGYTFCAAHELWKERRASAGPRWMAAVVPILHGMVFLTPIPLAVMDLSNHALASGTDRWGALFVLQALLYAVGTAFIVLLMVKERTMRVHRAQALTDPLTGLHNRRGFFSEAEEQLSVSAPDREFSVLMFDIDHFKSINDRFGHACGDEALRVFSATIRASMRADDLIGRLGGEEFVAFLPCTEAQAMATADRVRTAFEWAGMEIGGHDMNATVSVGVATAPAHAFDMKVHLDAADAALYCAKQNGRNRVESAPAEAQPPSPTNGSSVEGWTAARPFPQAPTPECAVTRVLPAPIGAA